MTRITRHSASAVLQMLPDGVLVVRLVGPLTGAALQYFKGQIVALHGPDIRAFVVDYTKSTIVLTGPELDAVLEGEPEDSAPTLPAAMVVRPDDCELFRGHALRVAGSHGIIRRVFSAEARALAWLRGLVGLR